VLLGPSGVWQLLTTSDIVTQLWGCSSGVHRKAAVDSFWPVYAHRQMQIGQSQDKASAKSQIFWQNWWVCNFLTVYVCVCVNKMQTFIYRSTLDNRRVYVALCNAVLMLMSRLGWVYHSDCVKCQCIFFCARSLWSGHFLLIIMTAVINNYNSSSRNNSNIACWLYRIVILLLYFYETIDNCMDYFQYTASTPCPEKKGATWFFCYIFEHNSFTR